MKDEGCRDAGTGDGGGRREAAILSLMRRINNN